MTLDGSKHTLLSYYREKKREFEQVVRRSEGCGGDCDYCEREKMVTRSKLQTAALSLLAANKMDLIEPLDHYALPIEMRSLITAEEWNAIPDARTKHNMLIECKRSAKRWKMFMDQRRLPVTWRPGQPAPREHCVTHRSIK